LSIESHVHIKQFKDMNTTNISLEIPKGFVIMVESLYYLEHCPLSEKH
jgi:hypothetical protein